VSPACARQGEGAEGRSSVEHGFGHRMRRGIGGSVATVWFGSVQTLILPNLELNFRFGSGKCLNLELNLPEPVQEVRFRFSGGSNPELNLKKL
jgi:hypothetical protein